MEDKIEKFKKLVVEGDFTTIKEKYPSKLMDKAYAYIGKKCEDWEKVAKEKYQVKKCKTRKEKKPKVEVIQEFSRKRIRVCTDDGSESDDEDDVISIKKSVKLENVLKKNKDHLKAIEGGKKRVKKEVKEVETKPAKKIEQVHIDSSVNINDPTNTDLIFPRKVVPLTNRYEVKENKNYFLIPQAYNIFLSSYQTVFPLFQAIKESSEEILKEEKPINLIENMIEIHKDLYKITCENNNNNIEIYYIDYLSEDLTVSPHLIPEKLYNKSIQYITKLFPHFYGDLVSKPCEISTNIRGYFPISNTECEIYEGRIYHIEGNCLEQPFESIRVIWYDQHKITGKWIFSFFQLDNILSPWDVEISEEADRFKSLISIEHLPHNPTTILTITQTLVNQKYGPEGNVIFKSLINSEDCPRYYEIIKQPLSFSEVLRKAEGNLYSNIDEYWKDLDLIISNAKTFNQKERFEWRCADILECCVERFKWEYTSVENALKNENENKDEDKKEKEKEEDNSVDFEEEATQRYVCPLIPIKDDKEDEESDTDQETQRFVGNMEEEEEEEENDKSDYEEEDTSDESQ